MDRRVVLAFALLLPAALPAQRVGGQRTPSIAGRILDADGPVAGARALARWLAHPELPPSIARALGEPMVVEATADSDDRGFFRIEVPPQVPLLLGATTADGRRASPRFPVQARDFVELRIGASATVEGVVRDLDGHPVAGAKIQTASFSRHATSVEKYRTPYWPASTHSDDDGRFRLTVTEMDPRDATHALRSLRAQKGDLISTDRFYRIDGQDLNGVELKLEQRSTLRGVVVDQDRSPLADADVFDPRHGFALARSGADGRFELRGVVDGIAASAPGHTMVFRDPVGQRDDHELILARGDRVSARLLDADGPCAGRRVLFAVPNEVPGGIGSLAWGARTDAGGVVAITRAGAGQTVFAFVEVGGRFVQAFATEVGDGDHDLGEIRVGPGRTIEGQVLDTRGMPLRDARVLLQAVVPVRRAGAASDAPAKLSRSPYHVTYTDRGGRFRFEAAPAGAVHVAASGGMHGVAMTTVTIETRRTTGPVELRLGEGATVRGTVVFPDGRPAADVQVQYILTGLADTAETIEPIVYLYGRTDGEGHFAFQGLPPHRARTCYALAAKDGEGFLVQQADTFQADVPLMLTLAPHAGRF